MLIWTNRNTEDGVGDNNYHFKENYCLIPNEKSILPDQKKIRTNNSGITWNLRKSQKVITETIFSKYNLKCLSSVLKIS